MTELNPGDYRQRLAEALANAECEKRPRCVNCMTDAAAAVRDEEIEALFELLALHKQRDAARTVEAWRHYAKHWRDAARQMEAEIAQLRADLADANATLTELAPLSLGVRAEKAEAAIERVRAYANETWGLRDPGLADEIIATLEGRDS